MKIQLAKPAGLALLALCVAAITGCDSSSDSDSSPAKLSGLVYDGPVAGATVRVFAVNGEVIGNELGRTTTSVDGSYGLAGISFSGPVLVVAEGGKFCAGSDAQVINDACATGRLTGLSSPMLTLAASTTAEALVTPFSTVALGDAIAVSDNGSVSGQIALSDFQQQFQSLTGVYPDASLQTLENLGLFAAINAWYKASDSVTFNDVLSNIRTGGLASIVQAPATVQASFSISQGGWQDLNGEATDTGITTGSDPEVCTPTTGEACSETGRSGNYPYFESRSAIDLQALITFMEKDSVADIDPFTTTSIMIGEDEYEGYRLADVIVRATKLRPRDRGADTFGAATVVVAFSAEGRKAVFSFNELIRTANGDKTLVAIAKNGEPLPSTEGAFAIVAGNDFNPGLRFIPRLKDIHIRNDFINDTSPAADTAPAFHITGAVQQEIQISTNSIDPNDTAARYQVTHIGERTVADFDTYYFQQYGPRHMFRWWGQGVRLTDVLDEAGLAWPEDKGACFVVVHSTISDQKTATFSCGELYNSPVGVGSGQPGEANRNRSQGVLLVTDDFRRATGQPVMMACWDNIENCTLTAGDDTVVTTYATDDLNSSYVALISTEDTKGFIASGRWYPWARNATGDRVCGVFQCNPYISVGDRMQVGIRSIQVFYAAGTGNTGSGSGHTDNGSPGDGSSGGSGGECSLHDQHQGNC